MSTKEAVGVPTMTAAELAAWEERMRGGKPTGTKAAGGERPLRPQSPAARAGLDNAGQPQQRCAHRWRIAEPNGPTSLGECRLCGATKAFGNVYFQDTPDIALNHKAVSERTFATRVAS